MEFGEKLKSIRKEKKISQQALADMMQVSLLTIRKWENNEKTPKKGEITKLCKKINCERKDLIDEVEENTKKEKVEVKEKTIEESSIDQHDVLVPPVIKEEEKKDTVKEIETKVVEEEVILPTNDDKKEDNTLIDKHDRRKMRGLSRAIIIISSIIRVLVLICIPIVLILMFLLPIVSSKIEIHDNSISLTDTKERISIQEEGENVWLVVNEERYLVSDKIENYAISVVREFLKGNSTERIVWHLEVELVIAALALTVLYYILRLMEKIFKNIYNLTPYKKDNQKYLVICAWLIISLIVLGNGANAVFSSMLKIDFMPSINLYYVILIIALFALKYVFKYGELLENNTKSQD